jgi:transcriptional regulator with PAS, ATPase and Fis domain
MRIPKSSWSSSTSTDEAHRRASDRRAYNANRPVKAMVRACEVMRLWGYCGFEHGSKARIAKELDIHRSTVTRDIRRVFRFDRDGTLSPNPR